MVYEAQALRIRVKNEKNFGTLAYQEGDGDEKNAI